MEGQGPGPVQALLCCETGDQNSSSLGLSFHRNNGEDVAPLRICCTSQRPPLEIVELCASPPPSNLADTRLLSWLEQGRGGGGGRSPQRGSAAQPSLGKQQGLLAAAPAPTYAVTAAVQLLASLLGERAKPLWGQRCGMSVSIATSQRTTFSEQFPYSAGFWT